MLSDKSAKGAIRAYLVPKILVAFASISCPSFASSVETCALKLGSFFANLVASSFIKGESPNATKIGKLFLSTLSANKLNSETISSSLLTSVPSVVNLSNLWAAPEA